jgi:hypothetical protein
MGPPGDGAALSNATEDEMSTFTRLYFVDRGPSIAEPHEPLADDPDAEFGALETAPSNPAADPDLHAGQDDDALVALARIPQSALERGSEWNRPWPSDAADRRDAWPGQDA